MQEFEQGNYLGAITLCDLVLYLNPQHEKARLIAKRAREYRNIQESLGRIRQNYPILKNESSLPEAQYLTDELRKLGAQLVNVTSSEFNNRWRKLTSLPYQALLNPKVWEQTNQMVNEITLYDLPASDTPTEIASQISNLLSTWLSEARLTAFSDKTLISMSINELGRAYHYARNQLQEAPNTENIDWQVLILIKNEFSKKLVSFGEKRLQFLRDAYMREDYAEANAIISSINEYEETFPDLVQDAGPVQDVYLEIRQLQNKINEQELVQQKGLSLLREAENFFLDNKPEQAEKILNSASIRNDLPKRLAEHVHDLRNRIQRVQTRQLAQQWSHSLEVFRMRLKFISKPKELMQLIQDLERLAKETNLHQLPDEERESYNRFIIELLEFNSALVNAEAWKKASYLAKKHKNNDEALTCLQKALDELKKYSAAQVDVQKLVLLLKSEMDRYTNTTTGQKESFK